MKKIMVLIVTLVLAFSLIACGGNGAATKTNEKPFVVASAEFNGDFYRGWTNSSYDDDIRKLIWAFGLMNENSKGQVEDSLLIAEKKVSDDLKTWTFKLVKEAKLLGGTSEARRLISQGGFKINDEPIKDIKASVNVESGMIIRAGKKKIVKVK